jgi:hypothetical protein
MYPTRALVKTQFQNLLDDPSGSVFSEAVFGPAFTEAYDALYTAMLTNQCPRIELITTATLPPGLTQLGPWQIGITNFGDYIYLAERVWGSADPRRDIISVDRLPMRPMADRLLEFNYRNEMFYFVGALNAIDFELKYDTSGTAPTADCTTIGVDGALTFLANYCVGVTGGRKGYDAIAERCLNLAVGPKYDQGTIGGELFRIIQTRVRSRQKVQIAPKPYSAFRRTARRRTTPYISATVSSPGGGVVTPAGPLQFSSQNGTILGAVDGINNVFTLSIGISFGTTNGTGLQWFVNGVLQASSLNYTVLGKVQIAFLPGFVPPAGAVITAQATPTYVDDCASGGGFS